MRKRNSGRFRSNAVRVTMFTVPPSPSAGMSGVGTLCTSMRLTETGDGPIKLDAFSVVAERETNATAIALNEQRYARNIKSVVSTDALGVVATLAACGSSPV
jgi:hypothetical protein